MREQLEKRIEELKAEFESGQKNMAELDDKRRALNNTLLRISGAIQVLQEELDKFNRDDGDPPGQSEVKEKPTLVRLESS